MTQPLEYYHPESPRSCMGVLIRALYAAGPQFESSNTQILGGSIQAPAAQKEIPWKMVYEA